MGAYSNFSLLVEEDNIGIKLRASKKQSPYFLHPLVRNRWGTKDLLRGAQGYYFAKGSYKGQPRLFDFVNHPWYGPRINRPLQVPGGGRFTDSYFTLYANDTPWNQAPTKKVKSQLEDYLSKPQTSARKGDPNFYQYLAGNISETTYYKSKQQPIVSPLLKLDTNFTDHHTHYYYPPTSKRVLEKSDYNLQVNSYYNFYLDTSPPYETVTSNAGAGAELVLPNLYMLESDIHNTASVNYSEQLTLNNASNFYDGPQLDVWFLKQNQTSAEGSQSYYQQFSETLGQLNRSGAIKKVKGAFKRKFRNVVVLYPDLDILKKYIIRDDKGTPGDTSDDVKSTSFCPFYNEVVVGFDKNDVLGIGGKPGAQSFFTSLFASKLGADEVRSFIVILQLYIVEMMSAGKVDRFRGQKWSREVISPTGAWRASLTKLDDKSDVVFKMHEFLYRLRNKELDYLLDVYNKSKEEASPNSNYTILREWEKGGELFQLNIKDAIKVANSDEFEELLEDRKRNLVQVYRNAAAPSETLMYLIEKRVKPTAKGLHGPLLQTMILSKDVVFSELLRYIDTQVKYGIRYKYEIKQVRVVFGNEYSYDSVGFDFGPSRTGEGRAVGNALGFYKPPGNATVNNEAPSLQYAYQTRGNPQRRGKSQAGNFIFSLPKATVQKLKKEKVLPSSVKGGVTSPAIQYYRAIQKGVADFSGLVVELHAGTTANSGMTAHTIEIPSDLQGSSRRLTKAFNADDEPNTNASPMPNYKYAIDLLSGDAVGSQTELDQTVREIEIYFRGIIERNDRQKVNKLLESMRNIRDNFAQPLPGTPSVVVSDVRFNAATTIYNMVDNKVRDLLSVVPSESDMKEVPTRMPPILKEILESEGDDPAQQRSMATTFGGPRGNKRNTRMKLRKM